MKNLSLLLVFTVIVLLAGGCGKKEQGVEKVSPTKVMVETENDQAELIETNKEVIEDLKEESIKNLKEIPGDNKIVVEGVKDELNDGPANSISGTITYEGAIPKLKEIKMDADPICLTHHSEAVLPDVLVLGEGQTLGNVFVYVKKGLKQKDFPVPTEEVVITQKGCVYTPHVLGVRAGQPVKILNPDGTLHNVHSLSKINPSFNIAMPKFRKEMTQVFNQPEFMFALRCDVHPWMNAWISVMDHPYFTVTKADGTFILKDLPPGEYEIEAWHEKLGTKTLSVIVEKDKSAVTNFTFSR